MLEPNGLKNKFESSERLELVNGKLLGTTIFHRLSDNSDHKRHTVTFVPIRREKNVSNNSLVGECVNDT